MKNLAFIVLGAALALAALWIIKPSPEPATTPIVEEQTHWREDYAYHMGIAALNYAYPWYRMAHVRWNWTHGHVDTPDPERIPFGALNQFWHATALVDSTWQEGGAPNNDTLYSLAWVHVKDEPMILSIPAIDRYYTFQFASASSDNFTYVSELKHGRDAGDYAVLPRGWQGELPEGVIALAEALTPWFVIVGRTYVANEADIANVTELQANYQIIPLSQWNAETVEPPQPDVFHPYDESTDPLALWKTMNRMLAENPPAADEAAVIKLFHEINIGPGLDVDQLDEHSRRGLARAARDGMALLSRSQLGGVGDVIWSNGWAYSADLGRAGAAGDFMTRTAHQSLAGIVSNDTDEAMYYGAFFGSDGESLDGSKRYRIRLPSGVEPEAKAFWSITIYDKNNNPVPNEDDRVSIGDRTEGLVRDPDGGLTIALQSERPLSPTDNWLAVPEGGFWLVLRAYQPSERMIDGEWPLPVVEVVE